eukprot:CAMPEP_0194409940 /NCGR_PEP_ID=MMETSP0176-20130528/7881_1 /TAXON_ID=216777 /ORGANISM="Proboscia alata, Strain PI-D3" /LENGTH=849 /DNA_ID=CAMNT_0039210883 /DNA_START=141 /DNA_END=2690 /DNA_ORIENTATION=-
MNERDEFGRQRSDRHYNNYNSDRKGKYSDSYSNNDNININSKHNNTIKKTGNQVYNDNLNDSTVSKQIKPNDISIENRQHTQSFHKERNKYDQQEEEEHITRKISNNNSNHHNNYNDNHMHQQQHHRQQHHQERNNNSQQASSYAAASDMMPQIGDIRKGTITRFETYGAFVDVDGYTKSVRALCHISHILPNAQRRFINHPSEALQMNQIVQFVISEIKPSSFDQRRLQYNISIGAVDQESGNLEHGWMPPVSSRRCDNGGEALFNSSGGASGGNGRGRDDWRLDGFQNRGEWIAHRARIRREMINNGDEGMYGYDIWERSPSPPPPPAAKKQKNSATKNSSVTAITTTDPIEKRGRSRSPSRSSSSSSRSSSFSSSGSSSSSSMEDSGSSREHSRNRSNNRRRRSYTNRRDNNRRRNASRRSDRPGRGRKGGGDAERRQKKGRRRKNDCSRSSSRSRDSSSSSSSSCSSRTPDSIIFPSKREKKQQQNLDGKKKKISDQKPLIAADEISVEKEREDLRVQDENDIANTSNVLNANKPPKQDNGIVVAAPIPKRKSRHSRRSRSRSTASSSSSKTDESINGRKTIHGVAENEDHSISQKKETENIINTHGKVPNTSVDAAVTTTHLNTTADIGSLGIDEEDLIEAKKFKKAVQGNSNNNDSSDDDDDMGPLPLPSTNNNNNTTSQNERDVEKAYGSALLPGEGAAIAQFVQQNLRIPRRGEIGYSGDDITHYETSGYVMSGSRHARMNAVRIRKENQIYSAEEQRALALITYEENQQKEAALLQDFRSMLKEKRSEMRSRRGGEGNGLESEEGIAGAGGAGGGNEGEEQRVQAVNGDEEQDKVANDST